MPISSWRAAFAPDGSTLATGGADERLVLWDVKRRTNLWTKPSDFIAVTSIAFTPDGRSLFASSYDQNLRSWKVEDPTQVQRLAWAQCGRQSAGHRARWTFASLRPAMTAPPGSGASQRRISHPLFRPAKNSPPCFLPEDMPAAERERLVIFGVAVSPAQDRAVAAENHRLLLCDLGTGTVLTNVAATNIFPGRDARIGRDSRFRRMAGNWRWGATTEGSPSSMRSPCGRVREPIQLHGNQVTHIAYALNGSVLVTGGGFGTGIKLTEVASGRVITNFSAVEGAFPMQPLAVTRDGQRLATGSPEGRVRVWDIASHQLVASSPWKVRFVTDLAFSPDGKLLAIAEQPGSIVLWDLSGQRPLRHARRACRAGEHGWPFPPMAARSPAPAWITRSGCGIRRLTRKWPF